jgi:membrane protein
VSPLPVEKVRRLWVDLSRAAGAIQGEGVRLRAMALTYISLFALVPALVVAFTVVQAFTGMDRLSRTIHEFLLENLAVGARASLEPYLDRFTQNAHLASASVVGGALLLWSAVSLFSNVEKAVNDLWGVRRGRRLVQQAVVYWMGLTLGPLLLAGSAAVNELARRFLEGLGTRVLAVTAAGLLTCVFFTLVYLVVPNTRVKLHAAVAGGFTAGVAWEVAKWVFALFVAKSVRYHAIYGSVAAIPIFLTWLYVSWTIVLFGARLAYVVQYASSVIGRRERPATFMEREVLAGMALLEVATSFEAARRPPEPAAVALAVGASGEETADVLAALRDAGLVATLASGGLIPARPPERISLLDVRQALLGKEDPLRAVPRSPLAGALHEAEAGSRAALARTTFADLCVQATVAPSRAGEGAQSDPSGVPKGTPSAQHS